MALIVRSSSIHNTGCYTDTLIRKGETVVEYTGPRITVEEGDRRYEGEEVTYLFGLEGGTHVIDGQGIARYINHSCDPNCETEELDGRVWIRAIRKIKPGEELSYDYMLYEGEGDAPCQCGARNCRGSLYSRQEQRKRKREAAGKVRSTKTEVSSKKGRKKPKDRTRQKVRSSK